MIDKYHMTVEENVFWAKRNIIDYIWKSAKLEGLSVTFPDTEAIYNNMQVSGVKADEIVAVNNLKHAWQFLFDTIEYELDYPYVCKLNQIVGSNLIYEAGFIRKIPVHIGGTSWQPEMPIEFIIKENIEQIRSIPCATERAIKLMLYIMRSQAFIDGNKRTAMLAANQIMIANGAGIISIPVELQYDFTKMLVEFYESGDNSVIMPFIYKNCIDGAALHEAKTPPTNSYNPANDVYMRVNYQEAMALKAAHIPFEGTVAEKKTNVIRIHTNNAGKVKDILAQLRKKITPKP